MSIMPTRGAKIIVPKKKMLHRLLYTIGHWLAKGSGIAATRAMQPKSRQSRYAARVLYPPMQLKRTMEMMTPRLGAERHIVIYTVYTSD